MRRAQSRPGFALVTSVVMMAAVAIVLGGVLGYVSYTVRASATAIAGWSTFTLA